MTGHTWPPDERAEFERLCREAWEATDSTRERTEVFLGLLREAEQAHRMFACDVLRDAESRGAASILKSWHKRTHRIAVSYNGKLLNKPRVVGTRRIARDGSRYAAQALFDTLTFTELTVKLQEYQRQADAYQENIHVCQRLLELHELAPDTSTPVQACQRLGTTIDDFLSTRAA